MNKSIVLQDRNGNNIYPIIPYQNVFGLPSASGKTKIFYGSGAPSNVKNDYKDIKVNDIYIDTDTQNRHGYFYYASNTSTTVSWYNVGKYVIENINPPTNYNNYDYHYYPYPIPGLIWMNTTNNKIFMFKSWNGAELIWKDLTDFYTKSEVDALFDELQFKINKKSKPIVETVTGSPIILEDSSNRDIKELTLYGKSTQTKTNGYQLLNQITENRQDTIRGITYSVKNDGSIRVDGTADNQDGNGIFIYIATKDYMNSLESGNHILNIKSDLNDLLIGSGNIGIYMNMYISTQKTIGSTIVTRANECSSAPYLWIKNGTTVHGNISIMLEKGTTAHTCEIFTGGQPSPSIDYPQTITDITSEQIEVKKKNLVSLSDVNKSNMKTYQCSYTFDNAIKLTATANSTCAIGSYVAIGTQLDSNQRAKSPLIPCLGGMTVIGSTQNNVFNYFRGYALDKDYTCLQTFTFNGTSSRTLPNGSKWICLEIGKSSATSGTTYTDNIQIEVGTTASEFEYYVTPQNATLSKTLRGIPVTSGGNYTDNNGQEWICDTIERYADGTGKLILRVAHAVIDGSQDVGFLSGNMWHFSNAVTSNIFGGNIVNPRNQTSLSTLFRVQATSYDVSREGTDSYNTLYISDEQNPGVMTVNANLFSAKTKAGMIDFFTSNPMTVLTRYVTPIEIPLTAEELAQLDLSTYKPITNIVSNTDAAITYVADTKNYIDKRMTELQNAIISQGGNV